MKGTPWQINMQNRRLQQEKNYHYHNIRPQNTGKTKNDYKRWKLQWKEPNEKRKTIFTGHSLLLLLHYYKTRPLFGEMEGTRDKFVPIVRLRFGHNRNPSHLHRIYLKDQPFCDCDGISHVDQQHIISCCPKHELHRENLV